MSLKTVYIVMWQWWDSWEIEAAFATREGADRCVSEWKEKTADLADRGSCDVYEVQLQP